MKNLSRREISRYLGAKRNTIPEAERYIVDCESELERTVVPRTLGKRLSLRGFGEESLALSHHLRHCTEGILFAITLGTEADRLLRRWSAQSMAKAAVGQACCAVWLDDLVAEYCRSILEQLDGNVYLTPPFSPGYGDWSLSEQEAVLRRLDAHRRIGLTLTSGGMLVPEKSITAIVGLSDRKEEACVHHCMRCEKTDCPFRGV